MRGASPAPSTPPCPADAMPLAVAPAVIAVAVSHVLEAFKDSLWLQLSTDAEAKPLDKVH